MNFLRLQHLDEFSSLPYQVISYYLEGSSNDEEKRFTASNDEEKRFTASINRGTHITKISF
ncbi:hypothetical protein LINGRAHAP2_LOCUS2586 [Linum grandiflorum]